MSFIPRQCSWDYDRAVIIVILHLIFITYLWGGSQICYPLTPKPEMV